MFRFLRAGLLWSIIGVSTTITYAMEPAQTSNATISDSLKSPIGAAVRSLCIPGWGQWYNNNKFKSIGAFTVEGSVSYFAIHEAHQYSKYGDENAHKLRNTLYWWLFLLHLVSVTDAYVDAYLNRFDDLMKITYNTNDKTLSLGIQIKW